MSDIPTVPPLDFNDPLTPIYGNTGSRFRFKEFKDVTNEQQDSRMPNFDKMMPKASTSNLKPVIEEEVERLLEPSSGSGLNVPAGISKKVATTAANPQLHFQKQSKVIIRETVGLFMLHFYATLFSRFRAVTSMKLKLLTSLMDLGGT